VHTGADFIQPNHLIVIGGERALAPMQARAFKLMSSDAQMPNMEAQVIIDPNTPVMLVSLGGSACRVDRVLTHPGLGAC
jgi:hypothetical protein